MKKYLSCCWFFILLLSKNAGAQNITGRWEGQIDKNQFLQINIIQKGDELCGYTFDHLIDNPESYCRAKFTGHYDANKKEWILQGVTMIENSDSHVLMKLRLWLESDNRDDLIRVRVSTGKENLAASVILNLSGAFLMARASSTFIPLGIQMQPCFQPEVSFERKVNKPVQQVTIGDSFPVATINKPAIDTAKKIIPKKISAVVLKKDSSNLISAAKSRQQKEQSHLVIDTNKVLLQLYDNGIIDGDTISVIYDGKLLVSHQLLSEKPIELKIDIDTTQALHTITLYAENLGSIPPNTALVVVTAGKKRYELFAKADLSENAVLVFEYKKE